MFQHGRILTLIYGFFFQRNCLSLIFKNQGQIAIFIALIFQILFLFFAMVINVGLLVHHKINLQNSVDIAAFYAAQKQAENLNAIAHVNYQIRQSWKLLTWRYRQVGTAGERFNHPWNKTTAQINPNKTQDDFDLIDFYQSPAYCVSYRPFNEVPKKENTCHDLTQARRVPLAAPVPINAGFNTLTSIIRKLGFDSNLAATDRCRYFGVHNYTSLGQFALAFNVDQAERMFLISKIARSMSEEKNNFRDLDGESVADGVYKTLQKNLTLPNRATLSQNNIEIYNSLGQDECNSSGVSAQEPPKWLSVVKIFPAFYYVDTVCNGDAIGTVIKPFGGGPQSYPNYTNELGKRTEIEGIAQYVGLRLPIQDPYNFSIGVEKNPWCMSYVGVKASVSPSIPFMPFGNIQLTAKATAKPFAGRIGPWYHEIWPESSNHSQGGKKTDPLLPPRLFDATQLGDFKDPARFANYSRFVGDLVGLRSNLVLGQYGRAIYSIDSNWQNNNSQGCQGQSEPCFKHWQDLGKPFQETQHGDILAWDSENDRAPLMRQLEISAIAPDVFDLTYYSIEPDYYNNYFLRLQNGLIKKWGTFDYLLRSDLGSRITGSDALKRFNLIDQMQVVQEDAAQKINLEVNKLSYIAQSWESVLTGWNAIDLANYDIDDSRYGKCTIYPKGFSKPGDIATHPNPGNCVSSFTGYSVKLVSPEYLRSDQLKLGGENAGAGRLKNPPPDSW